MAKKYDRNKYQNLKNQKASNEHQQEVCQLEINEIDAKIDDAEDAINWEINALNERKNEKYGILSGLVNAWDDLCTRIRNFFN